MANSYYSSSTMTVMWVIKKFNHAQRLCSFFTVDELKDGKGVIHNDKDKAEFANAVKSSFTPLLNRPRDQYDYSDMMKLVNGDVAGCFAVIMINKVVTRQSSSHQKNS